MSDDDGWIYGDGYNNTDADDDGAIIDPDAPLFLGTLSFCVCSLLLLPIFIAIGNRRARLRRAQKFWRNQGQNSAANNNLDTLIAERTSFDQYPSDGLCGCTDAVEDFLDKDVADIAVCNNNCFSMCNDKSKESYVTNNEIISSDNDEVGCNNCFSMCYDPPENSQEISDIRVHQPLHMNFQPPCTNTCTSPSRKRKSMDDEGLEESKRTKRNSIHDSPCSIRLVKQPSFCVGTDQPDERSMTPPRPPDSPSPKFKKKNRLSYKRAVNKYKRAVNAVTKKKPIRPLSQDANVPKLTFLDGGFYTPGNVRLHHQILQSQIDREHMLAKRRREEKKAAANAYIPPTVDVHLSVSFDNTDDKSVHTNVSSIGDEDVTNDLDVVWGTNSPYHPSKRKQIWDAIVRIARFDHESKRLVKLMAPFTVTALVCNMFAIIDIAIISAMLGGEILSAYLVTGYFLSMAHQVSTGFTDAHATLCAHAVGAGNYFLAGQYLQLAEIGFTLTAFLPLLLMGVFTYQVLVWLNVSDDVAEIGGNFAAVQVFALFIGGLNNVQMRFLNTIDPSNISNAIEILMNASYTAGIFIYLHRNADASLVDLAWIKLSVAVLFIPINIIALAKRGWLALCGRGMVKNALKNKEAVKQMMKAGIPLGIGSLIRESEWGVLVIFASSIGQDDVATFAVVRRMSDIFSSLIEGLCCGAELRCAYHMGRGNQLQASRSAYKSLIIGIASGAALAFSFYGVLGKAVFKLLDYDHIGAEGTQLIPLLCLCSIVMTIGMLGWALLGAQGRVRLATFITMVCSWIVTIPIAAIFVYVKRYDLQGLVAAVTMGYSVSSTVIMYLLIRSNWKKRLKKVMRAASFTVASFNSDDESTLAPDEVSDNDIRESADVGRSPPRISLIISSDSDLYNQLA